MTRKLALSFILTYVKDSLILMAKVCSSNNVFFFCKTASKLHKRLVWEIPIDRLIHYIINTSEFRVLIHHIPGQCFSVRFFFGTQHSDCNDSDCKLELFNEPWKKTKLSLAWYRFMHVL